MRRRHSLASIFCLLATAVLLGGCATTNQATHRFNEKTRALARSLTGDAAPPATACQKTGRTCPQAASKPPPPTGVKAALRTISNVFDHIAYVDVIANDLLQGNGPMAWRDTQRFVINTTLGLLGTQDVAARMGFPQREEDFGQTLGVWGVPEGPLIVLPFAGPRTTRSLFAPTTRFATNPLALVNEPIIGLAGTVIGIAGGPRADAPPRATGPQTYQQARDAYLCRRRALVRNAAWVEPKRDRRPLCGPVGCN